MDLVIDANILIAALIKDAPEFIMDEFQKYKQDILKKLKRSLEEFTRFLEFVKSKINFIPKEDSLAFLEKAKELSPDPKDAVYFAVALKMGANIWSNDKRLKSQNTIKIVSTNELIEGLSSMDV